MKIGSVILIILLVFIGSYAGLGYLVKQSEDMVAEINRLEAENTALTSQVDQLGADNKQLGDNLSQANARADKAEAQLATETQLKETALADARSCQAARTGTNLPGAALWGFILVPALGLSYTAWQKLVHTTTGKAQPVNTSTVTVQMTRQQMAEYIQYQRGKK